MQGSSNQFQDESCLLPVKVGLCLIRPFFKQIWNKEMRFLLYTWEFFILILTNETIHFLNSCFQFQTNLSIYYLSLISFLWSLCNLNFLDWLKNIGHFLLDICDLLEKICIAVWLGFQNSLLGFSNLFVLNNHGCDKILKQNHPEFSNSPFRQ